MVLSRVVVESKFILVVVQVVFENFHI